MTAIIRNLLAGFGLIVMIVSLVWLESMPRTESLVSRLPSSTGRVFPVVVLDPGHGGQDSGAMCGGILEKDLTLDVARRVERRLRADGLATVMTRVGDGYISLADRVTLTNRVPDCVLVSIHFNEGNKPVSSGIETYYAQRRTINQPLIAWLPFLERAAETTPDFESQSLAGFIQDALVSRTHAINRGTKPQQFYVLANVRHPAVLVEGGFITNKDDMSRLGNEDYREQMAGAIHDGVMQYRDLLKNRPGATPAEKGE